MTAIIKIVGIISGIVSGIVGIAVGLAILFSLPTMWLWNWLMPEIFGLKTISIWQALGILFLSGFLFRGNLFKKNGKN